MLISGCVILLMISMTTYSVFRAIKGIKKRT